jgi:uncharacterized protein (DUF2252 family)
MKREPIDEIIAFNAPLMVEAHRVVGADGKDLTAEALGRKLDALARSPFAFFRGTFHLMAADVLMNRVPGAAASAPDALIVGDLHLENFGVYRDGEGHLCFDVNDFDDVGMGPADLDLKRLCTSALLLPEVAPSARLASAKAIARTWAEAVEKMGGRYPIPEWDEGKAKKPVTELFKEKSQRTRANLLEKAAPGKNHDTFGEDGDPRRFAHVGKAWRAVAERALTEYLEQLALLKVQVSKVWDVLDVAYRFKGTGSLGRLRFSALLGRGDDRRIVEIKEARPSAMDQARGLPEGSQRARVQTASIRRLQAAPWPRVAGTHLGKVAALCREIQAEEEKLGTYRFAAGQGDKDHDLLNSYSEQCGEVTARLLVRANAPALLAATWSPQEAARAAVEFAQKYAQTVEADQRAFVKARGKVASALGLAPAK